MKLSETILFSLPYEVRRAVLSVLMPRSYRQLQARRSPSKDAAAKYAPFDQFGRIFVHVPKCGGVSVSRAVFGSVVQHGTIRTYQSVFSQAEFQSYFKFTFVRNPWDRLFSAWNFIKKGGKSRYDALWA